MPSPGVRRDPARPRVRRLEGANVRAETRTCALRTCQPATALARPRPRGDPAHHLLTCGERPVGGRHRAPWVHDRDACTVCGYRGHDGRGIDRGAEGDVLAEPDGL